MNPHVTVIAHGNGIAAFRRHEKYWRRVNPHLVVFCPEDDPVDLGGPSAVNAVIPYGKAERAGSQSIQRLRLLLDYLIRLTDSSYDSFLICEYDSIVLDPALLPKERGFYGVLQCDRGLSKFIAPVYANPPWFVDRKSLERMNSVALEYPGLLEGGEADRFLSALAFLGGVPILDYLPCGFTRGTIGALDILSMQQAIYDGCFAIHGIKQQWVLAAVEQFYDERHVVKGSKMDEEPIGQILPESKFGRLLDVLTQCSLTIVEIGTWRGGGSTQCIVNGLVNPEQRFYAIEADERMFAEAKSRHSDARITWLRGSVSPMGNTPIVLSDLPETIDLLLIDGGEDNGTADMVALIDRCRIIALDDTITRKNEANRKRLMESKWNVIADEPGDRHGWAVFQRP